MITTRPSENKSSASVVFRRYAQAKSASITPVDIASHTHVPILIHSSKPTLRAIPACTELQTVNGSCHRNPTFYSHHPRGVWCSPCDPALNEPPPLGLEAANQRGVKASLWQLARGYCGGAKGAGGGSQNKSVVSLSLHLGGAGFFFSLSFFFLQALHINIIYFVRALH